MQRYPKPKGKVVGSRDENQKLYYHRVNTLQDEDVVVAEFKTNPTWRMTSVVTHCGKYLIVSVEEAGDENLLYFVDLHKNVEIKGTLPLIPIVTKFEADYGVCYDLMTMNIFYC